MRISYLILIPVLGYSCCEIHHETTYTYRSQVITRIDKCGESSFYYQTPEGKPKGRILAKYSGINDGFRGFLKFDDDEKVTIVSNDGYFVMQDVDTSKFAYQSIYSSEAPEFGKNVYFISDSRNYEIDKNKGSQSAVKAVYHR